VTTFLERWRGRVRTLATFGDSITEALHIPDPADRWSNQLAQALGARLHNHGISGTVLQNSPDASGLPRDRNGRSRYEQDLLGPTRADLVAILYGSNDARYTAAPSTFHRDAFISDYGEVLAGLIAGGFAPEAIVIGSPPHIPEAGFAVGSDGFTGQSRDAFQLYTDAVKALAREAGTFYAPVNERMAAEGGDALISADHVHPNASGQAKIAEVFAAATQFEP
jgi:lysophospholipase L1-like esterase